MNPITQEIKEVLASLSKSWQDRRYEEISKFFHENAVFSLPGFSKQLVGQKICVDTYHEFMERSKIIEYSEDILNINHWDATAVATVQWHMVWESGTKSYDEKGHDVYTFVRDRLGWRIAWRAILALPG